MLISFFEDYIRNICQKPPVRDRWHDWQSPASHPVARVVFEHPYTPQREFRNAEPLVSTSVV